MKRIFLFVCVLMFVQLGQAVSQTITCESIEDMNWDDSIGIVRTCFMRFTPTIDTEAVSISPPDSKVLGLDFSGNYKISFLPIQLDETYPNLKGYDARHCLLKTVSKINFRNLKQLKQLHLSRNQIETIHSETFEDLTSLEVLALFGNKIRRMNGAAFERLNKLTEVWLSGNICISKSFDATAIADSLVREVNEKCGFDEPEASLSPTDETTNRIESTTKENRELSNEGSSLSSDLLHVFKSNETLK